MKHNEHLCRGRKWDKDRAGQTLVRTQHKQKHMAQVKFGNVQAIMTINLQGEMSQQPLEQRK